MTEPTPPPKYWIPAVVICAVVFLGVALASYFFHWHWAGTLWFGYTWPSLKGNGPEALVQTIVYGAIAIIFVPVVRRFIARIANDIHHSIHVHGTEITAHLHHIGKHLDLPEFEHSDAYQEHLAKHKKRMQ